MKNYYFEGQSTNGNLDEAIADAVKNALKELPTDMIIWKLEDMVGRYGGITNEKKLTVRINIEL